MNIHFESNNSNEHLILFVHGLQGNKETFFEPKDKTFFHENFEQSILNHVDIGYLEYHTEEILSRKSLAYVLSKIFHRVKKEPIENLNIEELSISAAHKIEKVISRYKSVNFICHSMGGLIVKGVLIRNANILDKTIFYITLATPHRGTNKAKFLNGINRQVKSLEENSQIITYLTRNYLTIKDELNRHYYRATDESWVLPKENAFPIFEDMHTSPVDCSHTDIAKPRFDLYLAPLIHDINKRIKNYLSLNKIISKELYNIDTHIIRFTKTSYLMGLQCQKSLWLKKYRPSIYTHLDTVKQTVLESGNVVGDLACELFPNGKKVSFKEDPKEMLYQTKQYIEERVQNIYEASFNYDGIFVIVDILRVDADGIAIYEVKNSTSVHDRHIHDVSIQYYVLKHLGFNIKSSNIVHIDNSYVRGDNLDINQLFSVVDVSEEVLSLQADIPHRIKEFDNCLSDKINEPDIDIGKHCNSPYPCDAIEYCWKHIPEYSIFDITRLNPDKKFELYHKNIINFDDIEDISEFSIVQKAQIISEQTKQKIINKEAIKEFLDGLTYPLYYLDFETFQQAIPEWKGIRPYMQIPFQYSLHVENINGDLEHFEFLAKEGIDPRYELAKRLVEDIPTYVTVLAYNMSFEKGVIRKLADMFDEFAPKLLAIHDNIQDLMTPFQKKDYYVPSMRGSYSIKYVLPALVPSMAQAYKELDGVQNGGEAMQTYAKLAHMKDKKEVARLREALLRYSELDTMSMVKILEELKKSVS